MLCFCGHEFGQVTARTLGVCPTCQRSIWMQVARTQVPDSAAIARELNRSDAKSCACTDWKTACFGFCGVLRQGEVWVPITPERRQAWFDKLLRVPDG